MIKYTRSKYALLLTLALTLSSAAFSQLVQDSVDLQPYDLKIEDDESDEADSVLFITPGADTAYPACTIYGSSWSNIDVNPYGASLANIPDTIPINLAGYTHPNHNVITSRFGFRRWKFHYGIDLRVAVGDPVRCAFDGRVRIARRGRAYGNYVVVRHYNGLETTYAHLSKIKVKVNDEIKSGDLVGLGGNTGRSSGPHLHYEIRFIGQAIDPMMIINFETGAPYTDTLSLAAYHFEYAKELEKVQYWTVRPGDSLWAISQKTGISIARICEINHISRSSILRLGQHIRYR
ncbi:MAG: peptidoglycan DD-metalloendopeptidase family protein [Prevotellaceae bacterium]|jgi:murein DD-endopeptidase MepM/ murein hydrolase activator NlpD|nr:peptidoglycan DD-metalloendopeptidase family protein [Prevotellaceae bacterium]